MHFHLVSLFPEFFDSPLRAGLLAKAQETGVVSFTLHNPRDYAADKHRSVDDRPYGGGPGMVMLLDPLAAALRAIPRPGRILVMSPGGRPLTQALARRLAAEQSLTLVCGRYEGFDARLENILPVEYVSVGDVVLNGGETPALVVAEAVSRLLPGFMGKEASGEEESFSSGLLEYPHYTRPENFEGHAVPEILRGGDHRRIARWRRDAALRATLRMRPDLLTEAPLDEDDAACLVQEPRERPGRNLHVILAHYPVVLEGKNSGASSLTNLDIHDIARLSRTYGLGGFYVATPIEDQRRMLDAILRHWVFGPAALHNPHRAQALGMVQGVPRIEDAVERIARHAGQRPWLLGTSAQWPGKKNRAERVSAAAVRQCLRSRPAALLLGTGHGLAPQALAACDALLRPLRFLDQYNHLSVRSAAAILVDRILGDVY